MKKKQQQQQQQQLVNGTPMQNSMKHKDNNRNDFNQYPHHSKPEKIIIRRQRPSMAPFVLLLIVVAAIGSGGLWPTQVKCLMVGDGFESSSNHEQQPAINEKPFVIDQDYEVSVGDQFVTADNDALFKCQLAPQMRDLFQVIGWLEDGQHLIIPQSPSTTSSSGQVASQQQQQQQSMIMIKTMAPIAESGSGSGLGSGGGGGGNGAKMSRMAATMLPDGRLYIPRVQLADANKSYRCQIKSLLNGRVSVSSLSGRLFVTDANEQSGTAPRIIDPPKPIMVAKVGEQLLIACLAQGSPRPEVRWFRQAAASAEATNLATATARGGGQYFDPDSDHYHHHHHQQQQQHQGHQHQDGQSVATDWTELQPTPWHLANESSKFVIAPYGSGSNLMLIRSLQVGDNRTKLRCFANNTFGAHQADTEIRLDLWPPSRLVELEPKIEHLSSGDGGDGGGGQLRRGPQSIQFNCTIRASPLPLLAIEWLKNGRQVFSISLPQLYNVAVGQQQQQQQLADVPTLLASNYNGSSLFDDPNQELNSIEYHLPPEDSSSSSMLLEHQHRGIPVQGDNEWPQHSFAATGSPDISASVAAEHEIMMMNSVGQQMGNFIALSTSINKLVSESEAAAAAGTQNSNSVGDNLLEQQVAQPSNLHRRLSQRLRLINRDTILYQLKIEQAKRSDRGSYQCRARNTRTTLQATSHLLLKDNPPQFVETFQSQLLGDPNQQQQQQHQQSHHHQQAQQQQQTGSIQQTSLKCVASGSPLPEISWTLSGFPLPESSRFRVGDYVTRDGLIVSFVNITNVLVEDGGLYECTATNYVGQLRHHGWLNVTGPPQIRPMSNVSAIAGHSMSIMCPVGGWPIEQVSWFQNSSKMPLNHRQKLFPNGTLLISELNEASDSGQYSCQAKGSNPIDPIAINHVHIDIKVPPFVEPFSFAKSLHRGQRYNIMCTVVRGDLPVSIRWFKDGRPIEWLTSGSINGDLSQSSSGPTSRSANLLGSAGTGSSDVMATSSGGGGGIAVKHLDPYSSTLTFGSLQSHHRGQYSCEATNEAGRASQSSSLVIHVPPEWRIEPKDLSVTVGKTAIIDCQADAFPAARIEWRLSQDLFREPPTEFKPIISSLYMRVFENGSLIIYNTQRTDAGYYLCQANNGVGPGLSRVIKLTVHVAAHFKAKIRTELVRRGHGARLRCESIGDLPIEINWLKDKMSLYGNEEPRYTITRTQLQDGLVSELNIIETERQDSALFTCITQNQYGNDDTNIQLIVQGPPDPPLDIKIEEYQARLVRISWKTGYSGNSPLIKYIIMYAQIITPSLPATMSGLATAQQPTLTVNPASAATSASGQPPQLSTSSTIGQYTNVTVGGNESSLLLQGLIPLTEYQFYMLALNSIGSSRLPNEPVKFRTVDEAPAGPPLFLKAEPTSSRSIRVRWRAPERRVHYGSIRGFYVGYTQQPAGGAPVSDSSFIYKTIDFNGGASDSAVTMNNRTSLLEQDCLITGLKRAQKYLIKVTAFNDRGFGPSSEPIITETWRVDVPDAPTLRMVTRTTHSIHLAWRLIPVSGDSALPAEPSAKSLPFNSGAGRQLQQAALVVRKNINDHIKSHHYHQSFATAAAATSNEVDGMDQPNGGGDASLSKGLKQQTGTDSRAQTEEIQADQEAQASEPILGFILTRKQISSPSSASDQQPQDSGGYGLDSQQTVEMRLPSDHLSQIVDNLTCGTRYQFTIVALNSMGPSAPSDPLIVRTEGSTPVAPDRGSLLTLNSSSLMINLGAWHNGACTMRSFDIMFKASRSKKWNQVTHYQVQQPQTPPLSATTNINTNAATNSQPDNNSTQGNQATGSQQLAQRSTGYANPQQPLQQQQQQSPTLSNSTIILDDLSSLLNYDLKILATNEAGTTEALYTFNTNGGNSLSGGGGGGGGSLINGRGDDQQWIGGSDLGETSLSELMASAGPLVSWLLLLLFVSLALSTGCIVLARRRRASSSSCSLSLSSASRSNQSSSNYYTSSSAAAAGNHGHHHLDASQNKANGNLRQANPRCPLLSNGGGGGTNGGTLQKLTSQQHHSSNLGDLQEEESPIGGGGGSGGPLGMTQQQNMMLMTDIYGHNQPHEAHLSLMEKSGGPNYAATYALGGGGQRRATSPHPVATTDTGSIINGSSEAELCLGASALNIGGRHEATQTKPPARSGDTQGYYVAPLLLQQQQSQGQNGKGNSLVSQLQQLGKSSTLPANCHDQILQQLIQQHQQQQIGNNNNNNTSQQQQLIDSLVAANMFQQQHQYGTTTLQPDGSYLALQQQQPLNGAGNTNEQLGELPAPDASQVAAYLEQQLQQQVYATVKRGCPRPPRLCDYTIYQCPNQPPLALNGAGQQDVQQQQQQLAMLRCCAELQGASSSAQQVVPTDHQQHVCYHPSMDSQQAANSSACNQTQTTSDYQQLRPVN